MKRRRVQIQRKGGEKVGEGEGEEEGGVVYEYGYEYDDEDDESAPFGWVDPEGAGGVLDGAFSSEDDFSSS